MTSSLCLPSLQWLVFQSALGSLKEAGQVSAEETKEFNSHLTSPSVTAVPTPSPTTYLTLSKVPLPFQAKWGAPERSLIPVIKHCNKQKMSENSWTPR